jgi:hypothetical protein
MTVPQDGTAPSMGTGSEGAALHGMHGSVAPAFALIRALASCGWQPLGNRAGPDGRFRHTCKRWEAKPVSRSPATVVRDHGAHIAYRWRLRSSTAAGVLGEVCVPQPKAKEPRHLRRKLG